MITLDGLTKRYGARTVLDALTLSVGPGEVVAIVGPNGAGKSTALRIVAGIIHPDAGTARIDGIDAVTDGVNARRRLGYLAQRPGVPAGTVLGDLAALVAAVRGVPYTMAVDRLDNTGLGARLGAALEELSGGERQRALLALATLGTVDALLLDEPSISLDAEGAEEVRGTIAQARDRGAAVLFASHHLYDVAMLADRIVVMVEGRAVAAGTLAALAAQAGVPWTEPDIDPPIERIYRTLVRAGQDAKPRLAVIRGDAA